MAIIRSLTFLLALYIAKASPASAEINPNAETNIMMQRTTYPEHWGQPPLAQTRDLVPLPGDYGRGSGTLRRWILEKMAEDEATTAANKKSGAGAGAGAGDDGTNKRWPDKDLVGLAGEEAKAAVLVGKSELSAENVHILPHDAMVTMDYREDRVRIFVKEDGTVARQPMIG